MIYTLMQCFLNDGVTSSFDILLFKRFSEMYVVGSTPLKFLADINLKFSVMVDEILKLCMKVKIISIVKSVEAYLETKIEI